MQRVDFDDSDLPLSEVFAALPDAALVFIAKRMLCPGCPVAPFHTITDACLEYGLNEDDFRQEVQRWIDGAGGGESRHGWRC